MERGKVEVKIDEMYQLYYRQGHGRISAHKRRAKGKEYVTPRVMLRRYFNKHIGRKCFVYEGHGKVGHFDGDIIILLLR